MRCRWNDCRWNDCQWNKHLPVEKGPMVWQPFPISAWPRFDAWMSENPVGLLRSPLFSGKTTLIELLSIYLRRLGRTVVTITIQESENHFSSKEAFDAFWIAEAGISWSSCFNTKVQMEILVNEAQILYRHVPWFWSHLKNLLRQAESDESDKRVTW